MDNVMSYNDELSNVTLSYPRLTLSGWLCVIAFSQNTMDKEHPLHKNTGTGQTSFDKRPAPFGCRDFSMGSIATIALSQTPLYMFYEECLLIRGGLFLIYLTSLESPTEAQSWVLRSTFHSMNMANVANNCMTFPLQITLDLSPGVSSAALLNLYILNENL